MAGLCLTPVPAPGASAAAWCVLIRMRLPSPPQAQLKEWEKEEEAKAALQKEVAARLKADRAAQLANRDARKRAVRRCAVLGCAARAVVRRPRVLLFARRVRAR